MSGEENRVILTSGKKVVYPSQGPCLIGPVIKKVIDARQIRFSQLTLLGDSGGALFVAVDKVQTIGIRPLLNRSDIPKLLDLLKEPPEQTRTGGNAPMTTLNCSPPDRRLTWPRSLNH